MNLINRDYEDTHLWKVKVWKGDGTKVNIHIVCEEFSQIEKYVDKHFEGGCVQKVKWIENMSAGVLSRTE